MIETNLIVCARLGDPLWVMLRAEWGVPVNYGRRRRQEARKEMWQRISLQYWLRLLKERWSYADNRAFFSLEERRIKNANASNHAWQLFQISPDALWWSASSHKKRILAAVFFLFGIHIDIYIHSENDQLGPPPTYITCVTGCHRRTQS